MHPPPTGPDALSVAQACRLLNRHPAFVFRAMLSGRLRYWKLGRRRVLARADVLALITPGAAPAPAPKVASRREVDAFTRRTLERFGLA